MSMELLSSKEQSHFETCEAIIKNGLDNWLTVGQALLEIRDKRLYRQDFNTFDAYCKKRWDMGKAHAYRLITASEVVAEVSVSPNGRRPTNERQARALAKAPAGKRAEVLAEASADGEPTAAKIETARKRVESTATKPDPKPKPPKSGRETISPKLRKAVLAIFGQLVRAIGKLGLGTKIDNHLEAIRVAIQEAK